MKKTKKIAMFTAILVVLFILFSCDNNTDGSGNGNGSGNENDNGDGFPTGTSVPGETLAEKLQWLTYNAENDNTYLLELSSAYEPLASQSLYYAGRSNIAIRLRGKSSNRVIEISGDGSIFTITNSITLILDNNITLIGKNSNSYSLITVNTGGTLIINEGAKISGNTVLSSSKGGGVSVSGTFIMNGGEVSGNKSYNSGGVYVGSGTFNMSGGKIFDNTCYDFGGGVYVWGGTFVMSGGEISGNNDSGVYIYGGTFTMGGGEISKNNGGVYIYYREAFTNGTFTKSGGGIITGYASDTVNGNVGYAINWYGLMRKTTLGTNDNVNFSSFFNDGATALIANSWADGNISLDDNVQWFKFTATANTQYIHVNFGTLNYLYIQVYDSVGNCVEIESYSGNGGNKYISRMVTSGQEYYIRVGVYSSSSGTYQIAFNTSSTAPEL